MLRMQVEGWGQGMHEGYYSATFGTIFGLGHIRFLVANQRISGTTRRGVPVEGHFEMDKVRSLMRFDVVAHLPPFFTAVTGLATDAKPRSVRFKGMATPIDGGARFSIDFAGRAVDVDARYEGPVEGPAQVAPRRDETHSAW